MLSNHRQASRLACAQANVASTKIQLRTRPIFDHNKRQWNPFVHPGILKTKQISPDLVTDFARAHLVDRLSQYSGLHTWLRVCD